METFGMILLTLLTVLGSAILGWLARRYALGGRCEPFGSDKLAGSLSGASGGAAAGAVGAAAAGTAAVGAAASRFAAGGSSANSQDGGASGSTKTRAANFSAGTGSDTRSGGQVISADHPNASATGSHVSSGAASARVTPSSSSGSSGSNSSTSAKWFDGNADVDGSAVAGSGGAASTGGSGSTAAAAIGTAGAVGAAAKLVSGSGDDAKTDASKSSGVVSSNTGASGAASGSGGGSANGSGVSAKAGAAGQGATARDHAGSGSGGAGDTAASGSVAGSAPSDKSGEAPSGSAGSTMASGFVGQGAIEGDGSSSAPSGASSTAGSTQPAARGATSHGGPSGNDASVTSAAFAGAAAGGYAASDDDDDEDDGVSLVDVPASLSAEEAEAERLLASDEDIAAPSSRLDAPRPSHSPDDLTKIKGIGPKINGQLNDRGIYYYDQIADFSGSDLAWADRELGFKGRAVRDRWIPQARGLMDASALDGTGSAAAAKSVTSSAGVGMAAGGLSSTDNDEDDEGVSLVDIPASLSAEEAEAERLLASDEDIAAPSSRLDAPRPSHSPDDLTKIKGIGPKINGQLNDRGIYYYDQIADFSGSDLAWADRELGFKGRAVRDRWIPQARGLMDASALNGANGKAAKGSGAASPELTASQAEVRQLRTRLGLAPDSGSGANDPSKSDAQRLEASQQEARELRQQLWSKEEAEKAEKAKAAASASGSTSGSGAAGATAGGATAAAGFGDFGDLSSEEAEAKKLIASGSAPKAASNKLDAPTPGFDPDDLTKIRGIGKPTQSRLNRNGVYYYDQIAGFTGADLAWADKEMNLEGRVVSDRWIPQAKLLAGEVEEGDSGARAAASATAASGSSDSGSDGDDASDGEALVDVPKALTPEEAEAERLLESGEDIAPPASRLDAPRSGQSPDDLTKIKGIGRKINGKLNDQGIYYYDQIAGFKGSDLAWADRELDFKGRAVRDRWVPQARGLMELSGSDEPVAPAPKTLLDKPIEGRAPDDLTAIKGIGNVLQKQLNEKGIYYYSQIAEFSDSDQEWANQTLGFPGRVERDDWIPQARKLMESGAAGRTARQNVLSDAGKQLNAMSDDVEPSEMSGDESEAMRLIESGEFVADESNRPASLLSSASQGAADDLQRIKGVGPKLNDLLNSLGIFYFRQIADFSATDIAWVDSKLQFKGRIVRDRWVDQAKRLS